MAGAADCDVGVGEGESGDVGGHFCCLVWFGGSGAGWNVSMFISVPRSIGNIPIDFPLLNEVRSELLVFVGR